MHDYMPVHIYIKFRNRRWDNMILTLIYGILRVLIVSVWYYFVPFVALMASFVVPALVIQAQEAEASNDAAA